MIEGRRHDLGLGGWPLVTLNEARDVAFENRRSVRRGVNILETRRRALDERRGVPTFAEAAETVLEMQLPAWKDGGLSERHWRASMSKHVLPKLGKVRVDKITVADVVSVIEPLWREKRETGRKMKTRINRVMQWSLAHGYRLDNPVVAAGAILPKGGRRAEHMKALPWQRLPETLAVIRESGAYATTKLGLEFLALTATRSGETRAAQWSEFDLGCALWTIPGERTKTGRSFRVPLSDRAMGILKLAGAYRDGSGLVFPSMRGRMMSDNTLSKLFRDKGIPAVPHGFRSSFRDWCSEATEAGREVAEAALAHVTGNKAEAAYARSDLLDKRRPLMQQWADHLTIPTEG